MNLGYEWRHIHTEMTTESQLCEFDLYFYYTCNNYSCFLVLALLLLLFTLFLLLLLKLKLLLLLLLLV